jgi:hypothetical protein
LVWRTEFNLGQSVAAICWPHYLATQFPREGVALPEARAAINHNDLGLRAIAGKSSVYRAFERCIHGALK